jgi:CheY-like chemotaxis protein
MRAVQPGTDGFGAPALVREGFMSLNVLVVEDEGIIAMLLEDMLNELGHNMVAAASSVEDARAQAAKWTIDLAILDVNLGRQSSYPLAQDFRAKGIPFILATGYGAGGLDAEWRDNVVLQKPFEVKALSSAIAQSLATRTRVTI